MPLQSQREEECQNNPGSRSLWGVSCRKQCRHQTDGGPLRRPRNNPRRLDPFGTPPAPASRGRNGAAVRRTRKVDYLTSSAPPRATADPRSLLGHPRREAAAHLGKAMYSITQSGVHHRLPPPPSCGGGLCFEGKTSVHRTARPLTPGPPHRAHPRTHTHESKRRTPVGLRLPEGGKGGKGARQDPRKRYTPTVPPKAT